jgi:hypothetical protein
MSQLREYLTAVTRMVRGCITCERPYVSMEDYVADRGVGFAPAALTADEEAVVRAAAQAAWEAGCRFRVKECYYNAQMLVSCDVTERLQYYEGFGLHIIACLHGWAVINGKVVDLTWRRGDNYGVTEDPLEQRYVGTFDHEYIGIHFPEAEWPEFGATVIDRWQENFPALQVPRIGPPLEPYPEIPGETGRKLLA